MALRSPCVDCGPSLSEVTGGEVGLRPSAQLARSGRKMGQCLWEEDWEGSRNRESAGVRMPRRRQVRAEAGTACMEWPGRLGLGFPAQGGSRMAVSLLEVMGDGHVVTPRASCTLAEWGGGVVLKLV